MATSRSRKESAVTAVGGLAAVGGGAAARERGINRSIALTEQHTGKPAPRHFPPMRNVLATPKVAGRGRARALYALGGAVSLAGGIPLTRGVYGTLRPKQRETLGVASKRDDQHHSVLLGGLRGVGGSVKDRVDNSLHEKAPRGAQALPLGISVGSGALGSLAANLALSRRVRPGVRAAGAALAGAAAGAASLPASQKALDHRYPGYQITPSGVRRRKTPFVRPSSTSTKVSRRNGPLRGQVVPSDMAKRDYTDHQRRALITAAATTPGVGSLAGPLAARRLSNPQDRNRSAAEQWAGSTGGKYTGYATGAYAGAKLAERNPKFAERSQQADAALTRVKQALPGRQWAEQKADALKTKIIKPTSGNSRMVQRVARLSEHVPGAIKRNKAAATVGALAGGLTLGVTGTQTAITFNNRRNHARASVAKLAPPVLSPREQVKQQRQKRRVAAAGLVSNTLGVTSIGLLGASALKGGAAGEKLAARSFKAGVASGGLGGLTGLRANTLAHRDANREVQRLKIKHEELAKALLPVPAGVGRAKALRPSVLATRRLPNGIVRQYRVRGGVG